MRIATPDVCVCVFVISVSKFINMNIYSVSRFQSLKTSNTDNSGNILTICTELNVFFNIKIFKLRS